ncbi:hypothetical protein N8148_03075 [Gammaproteobacteria bacterium]|nr:hypothetical protein [Gammaproteobacteria bacterium]
MYTIMKKKPVSIWIIVAILAFMYVEEKIDNIFKSKEDGKEKD